MELGRLRIVGTLYMFFAVVYALVSIGLLGAIAKINELPFFKFVFLTHLWGSNSGLNLPWSVTVDGMSQLGYLCAISLLVCIYCIITCADFGLLASSAEKGYTIDQHRERYRLRWRFYMGDPGYLPQHSFLFFTCCLNLLSLIYMDNAGTNQFFYCIFMIISGCACAFLIGYAYQMIVVFRNHSRTMNILSWTFLMLGVILIMALTIYMVVNAGLVSGVMTDFTSFTDAGYGTALCILMLVYVLCLIFEVHMGLDHLASESARLFVFALFFILYILMVTTTKSKIST